MQQVPRECSSGSATVLLPTHRLGQSLGSTVVPSDPERLGSLLPQSLGAGQMLEPPGVCRPCPQALRWLTSPALRATWVS